MAVVLGVFLLVIRTFVVGLGWSAFVTAYAIPRVLGYAYYDFCVLGSVTLVFLGLVHVARSRVRVQQALRNLYLLWAVFSLLLALINLKAVGMLGVPLNYQWLYYSDFLTSFDARQAIADTLSWGIVGVAVAATGGLIVGHMLLRRAIEVALRRWIKGWHLVAAVTVLSLCYFPITASYLGASANNQRLAHPAYAFLCSVFADETPSLLAIDTPFGSEDFRIHAERGGPEPAKSTRSSQIKNVLIFVFESVPAEYVEAYGGTYPVTPELTKARSRSILFRNIYAHAPATNKTLVSMLCSIYPWISFRSVMQDHPEIQVTSLSSVLREKGYRTGFFFSSDLSHGRADVFLRKHDFDLVEDSRGRSSGSFAIEYNVRGGTRVHGSDDVSTAGSLIEWVKKDTEHPFFSVMWTLATHHPYFVTGEAIDFGVKSPHFHRYLNALRHGDEALGRILRMLDEEKLAESTLVVVLADHGEAFGRHNQTGHAADIYEENIHVPLMLINPRLFHGEENRVVGGIIDIAPTVLDLLGLPMPAGWQGRSLLGEDRSPRVYFFAPFSQLLFGYREGDRKFVYNATKDSYRIHDLASDPTEGNNLARHEPGTKVVVRQRLAAWLQYQNRLLKELVSR